MELDHLDRAAADGFDGYIVRKDLVRKFARQYPVPTMPFRTSRLFTIEQS